MGDLLSNESKPWQLTVADLRSVLKNAPDEAIVALVLPPETPVDANLTVILNAKAHYSGGPVVQLSPLETTQRLMPGKPEGSTQIAAAANVLIPAILVLERQGFVVTRDQTEGTESWSARRGEVEAVGSDPVELLGLVGVLAERGPNWAASDSEFVSTFRRFELES